jgi:hypothetical protein
MIRQLFHRFLIALAGVTLLLSVVFVIEPGVLSPVVDPDSIEARFAEVVGPLVVSVTLIIGSGVVVWKSKNAGRQSIPPLVTGDKQAKSADRKSAILAFDTAMRDAIETGDLAKRKEIREQLRAAVIQTLLRVEKLPQDTAREAVLCGEWTDDQIVAAFLGDMRAPETPLRWRVYTWLYDEKAFKQSVDRTLELIEQRYEESK